MTTTPADPPFPVLTEMERRVATHIARGEKRADVAKKLQISPKTYDTHRRQLLAKLGVANDVELALLAAEKGWVTR